MSRINEMLWASVRRRNVLNLDAREEKNDSVDLEKTAKVSKKKNVWQWREVKKCVHESGANRLRFGRNYTEKQKHKQT